MIGTSFGKKLQQSAITAHQVEISDAEQGDDSNLTNLIFFEGKNKDKGGAKRKYNY